MKFRLSRLAVAILAASAFGALWAVPARADTDVRVDFAAAHAFTGVGAELDLKNDHPQEAAQLLRDLNAQFVRMAVIPNIKTDLPTGQSVERYAELLQGALPPKITNHLARVRAFLEPLHIKAHIVFWHMPESWEAVGNGQAGKKKEAHKAVDERLPDYANLLTAELQWVTRQGIEPYAVELTNEPQGGWDTKYTPTQYADLVVDTRRALDAHGLQAVRIEGPGAGVRNFPDFLQGLRSRNALGSLAFISAHAYQTPQQIADPGTPGYSEFLGHGQYGEIVLTEYGVKRHNGEDQEAAAADLDVGTHEYGLAAGAESIELMGKGASALLYWELSDVNNNPKKHGAIDNAGHRRPVAYALQALFGHVPVPSRTVAGAGGLADVPVEGVAANGRVWLMMANLTASPQRVTAHINGAAVHGVGTIDGFANGALATGVVTDASVRGDTFTGVLAPHTLATVSLQ